MGSIKKDILGGVSGKVGTIVGVHWKSNYYIRAHAAKVSNPRTPKQQEQRGKFAMAFSFLRIIKPFIRIGYKEFTGEKSAYNAAMSYMLKKVILNKGKNVFNWKDNSGTGNAEDTDIAMVLAYNKDKGMAVYDTEADFRQDGTAELMIPDEWQDDELIAYLSFRSADGSSVANSVRMVTEEYKALPSLSKKYKE